MDTGRGGIAEGYVPSRSNVRFNHLIDPEPIFLDTDFASIVRSNVPIVVQQSRLDSR